MYFGRNELFDDVINPNLFKIMPAIGAKLFKKELLTKHNIQFSEGISGQDLVFFLNSIINSSKVNVLNNFYVYYRTITKHSVTFNFTEKYFYGLIKAYSLICDLFKKHHVDFNIQQMLLTNHLIFFTTQVLRANFTKNFDNITLNEILNSENFDKLSKKEIFQGNVVYEEFFRKMNLGYYKNHPLLEKITDKYKPKLINEYSFLKEYNFKLKQENENLKKEKGTLETKFNKLESTNNLINDELNSLRNELTNLSTQNEILKNDLNKLNNENDKLKNELKK